MSFLNHPLSGLFTNKFLHVSINNKLISINRKETYTVLIVLQKPYGKHILLYNYIIIIKSLKL
jgi:hypothetical protein